MSMQALQTVLEESKGDIKTMAKYFASKREYSHSKVPKPKLNEQCVRILHEKLSSNVNSQQRQKYVILVVVCLDEFSLNMQDTMHVWIQCNESIMSLFEGCLKFFCDSMDNSKRRIFKKFCSLIIKCSQQSKVLSALLFNKCADMLIRMAFRDCIGEDIVSQILDAVDTSSQCANFPQISETFRKLETHLRYVAKMVYGLSAVDQTIVYSILQRSLKNKANLAAKVQSWFPHHPELQSVFIEGISKPSSEGSGMFANKLFQISRSELECKQTFLKHTCLQSIQDNRASDAVQKHGRASKLPVVSSKLSSHQEQLFSKLQDQEPAKHKVNKSSSVANIAEKDVQLTTLTKVGQPDATEGITKNNLLRDLYRKHVRNCQTPYPNRQASVSLKIKNSATADISKTEEPCKESIHCPVSKEHSQSKKRKVRLIDFGFDRTKHVCHEKKECVDKMLERKNAEETDIHGKLPHTDMKILENHTSQNQFERHSEGIIPKVDFTVNAHLKHQLMPPHLSGTEGGPERVRKWLASTNQSPVDATVCVEEEIGMMDDKSMKDHKEKAEVRHTVKMKCSGDSKTETKDAIILECTVYSGNNRCLSSYRDQVTSGPKQVTCVSAQGNGNDMSEPAGNNDRLKIPEVVERDNDWHRHEAMLRCPRETSRFSLKDSTSSVNKQVNLCEGSSVTAGSSHLPTSGKPDVPRQKREITHDKLYIWSSNERESHTQVKHNSGVPEKILPPTLFGMECKENAVSESNIETAARCQVNSAFERPGNVIKTKPQLQQVKDMNVKGDLCLPEKKVKENTQSVGSSAMKSSAVKSRKNVETVDMPSAADLQVIKNVHASQFNENIPKKCDQQNSFSWAKIEQIHGHTSAHSKDATRILGESCGGQTVPVTRFTLIETNGAFSAQPKQYWKRKLEAVEENIMPKVKNCADIYTFCDSRVDENKVVTEGVASSKRNRKSTKCLKGLLTSSTSKPMTGGKKYIMVSPKPGRGHKSTTEPVSPHQRSIKSYNERNQSLKAVKQQMDGEKAGEAVKNEIDCAVKTVPEVKTCVKNLGEKSSVQLQPKHFKAVESQEPPSGTVPRRGKSGLRKILTSGSTCVLERTAPRHKGLGCEESVSTSAVKNVEIDSGVDAMMSDDVKSPSCESCGSPTNQMTVIAPHPDQKRDPKPFCSTKVKLTRPHNQTAPLRQLKKAVTMNNELRSDTVLKSKLESIMTMANNIRSTVEMCNSVQKFREDKSSAIDRELNEIICYLGPDEDQSFKALMPAPPPFFEQACVRELTSKYRNPKDSHPEELTFVGPSPTSSEISELNQRFWNSPCQSGI